MDLHNKNIPFNLPYTSSNEIENIIKAFSYDKICGDGFYTKQCHEWLKKRLKSNVLITPSCSAALEMMAILLDAQPGDEVIMPSFTFVSTANAFVLRGIKPVFVDIREDILNIDERLIESAITEKTKAICCVHYAGVGCNMDSIKKIASKYNLYVFEDAAQGFGAKYNNQILGTIGDLGAYSFHETKNISSGEGGCLILNDKKFIERAEIIREKGTNRSNFHRGLVDKYTWVDIGSSHLVADYVAAYLYAQLQRSEDINKKRMHIWNMYHSFFAKYEERGLLRRPIIPSDCSHNAHIYYLLFNDLQTRTNFIEHLNKNNIQSVFHYVPLHSSPAGEKYCRTGSDMHITNKVSDTLVRLPLYYTLSDEDISRIFCVVEEFLGK